MVKLVVTGAEGCTRWTMTGCPPHIAAELTDIEDAQSLSPQEQVTRWQKAQAAGSQLVTVSKHSQELNART